MQKRTRKWLSDVLDATDYIKEKTAAMTAETYVADRDLRFAIERNLLIIGEALVRVRDHDPAVVAAIPSFRQAIGLRNTLVHAYDEIDNRWIWDTISDSVPELARQVREVLEQDEESTSAHGD